MNTISRRQFFKMAALSGAGLLLAACAPAPTPRAAQDTPPPVLTCGIDGAPCGDATATPGQALTPTAVPAAGEVQRVDLATAKQAFDDGTALFLDMRSQAQFDQLHITGAVLIPSTELEARYQELDAARWIITYCT